MDERYKTHSVLKRSILERYVECGDFDTAECAACFNNEVNEALRLYPVDVLLPRRQEALRPLIIKVLIYIGVVPGHFAFGPVARIIERLVAHPGTDVSDVIVEVAEKTNSSVQSILHNIDSNFDIRDDMMYERVTTLTKTKPLTARDMLVDVAQYISYSIRVGEAVYAYSFRK